MNFCSHQVAQVPSSENPLLRDRALLFQEHRALGCASIPFPEGCRSSSGVRASSSVAEKGNPREAEPPGPTNTIPVPLGKGTNPQSLQQLQTFSLLSHKEFHCSFTSTSIRLKGKLGRGSVQVPQCPHSSWEHPLPALPSATPAKTPGNASKTCFPQEKHSNSLKSNVKTLFFSSFHRDVVLGGRVSSCSWSQGSLVCPSGKGDSELQRFPKATGTEGLQKTPEEEKQQHLSILKLPETH